GFENPEGIAQIIGMIEIIGAATLLVLPLRSVILLLFLWKMASETQYPAYPIFEWVERGGSYAALLALWIVLKNGDASRLSLSLKNRISRAKKEVTLTN